MAKDVMESPLSNASHSATIRFLPNSDISLPTHRHPGCISHHSASQDIPDRVTDAQRRRMDRKVAMAKMGPSQVHAPLTPVKAEKRGYVRVKRRANSQEGHSSVTERPDSLQSDGSIRPLIGDSDPAMNWLHTEFSQLQKRFCLAMGLSSLTPPHRDLPHPHFELLKGPMTVDVGQASAEKLNDSSIDQSLQTISVAQKRKNRLAYMKRRGSCIDQDMGSQDPLRPTNKGHIRRDAASPPHLDFPPPHFDLLPSPKIVDRGQTYVDQSNETSISQSLRTIPLAQDKSKRLASVRRRTPSSAQNMSFHGVAHQTKKKRQTKKTASSHLARQSDLPLRIGDSRRLTNGKSPLIDLVSGPVNCIMLHSTISDAGELETIETTRIWSAAVQEALVNFSHLSSSITTDHGSSSSQPLSHSVPYVSTKKLLLWSSNPSDFVYSARSPTMLEDYRIPPDHLSVNWSVSGAYSVPPRRPMCHSVHLSSAVHKRTCYEPLDLGGPTHVCPCYGAHMWYGERTNATKKTNNLRFNMCCQQGTIRLPSFNRTPPELDALLDYGGGSRSLIFRENLRFYNSLFQFTSFGGKFDRTINSRPGPYVLVMLGDTYHKIGSLLPPEGQTPKFSQLYIYDTDHEI
ncbi:ATP-dependent DNA helicase PIF1 [Corchorus olitorius]|uniref:ATP-dependent DNA helicase PIF1 n=1 Tax=Corchorus olitorius TaxID=93759 RepID=A0A1R3KWR2_9ROSI|nr:ATP-dependent DNA helicase PIF1 [Corchorus olitorius]